ARVQLAQRGDVRAQLAYGALVVQEHEQVEAALADPLGLGAERAGEAGGRLCGGGWRRWEVELDPLACPRGREQPAARVEVRGLVRREVPVLPEHVRAGEGRVAAEVDLGGRGEPAQVIGAVVAPHEE